MTQEKQVDSIREVDLSQLKVPMIALYQHPEDFPDKWIARVFDIDQPTETIIVKETMEEITQDIYNHTRLVFLTRSAGDVPALVGTWI